MLPYICVLTKRKTPPGGRRFLSDVLGLLGVALADELFAVYDEALVRALADYFDVVVGGYLKDQAAAVNLYERALGGAVHTDGSCGHVLDVQRGADRGHAGLQIGRDAVKRILCYAKTRSVIN